MSACRLSMSSTRKTYIAPAYSWPPEAVDAGAGAVQCTEAAAAVAAQWAEPAEAAEAAVVAAGAGAAAHGLDLSGSARTRVVRTRARDDRSCSENAFRHVSRYSIRVLTVHADGLGQQLTYCISRMSRAGEIAHAR